MARQVVYSAPAKEDLRDISLFQLRHSDLVTVNQIIKYIQEAITFSAQQPMVGSRVEGKSENYRQTNILKAKFKVYYLSSLLI